MKGTLRKSCAARSGLHRGATERSRTILRPTPTENERRHTKPLPCLCHRRLHTAADSAVEQRQFLTQHSVSVPHAPPRPASTAQSSTPRRKCHVNALHSPSTNLCAR